MDEVRGAVGESLHALFSVGSFAGWTDRQLLERFQRGRDEVGERAFAALVERHGAGVLRVCRGVLGDSHDAEDAFQATFLVLARRAGTIRDRDAVGAWLMGVAFRVAGCAGRPPSGGGPMSGRPPWASRTPSATTSPATGGRCSTRRSAVCRRSSGRPWPSATSRA